MKEFKEKPSDLWQIRDPLSGKYISKEMTKKEIQLWLLSRVKIINECWEWQSSIHRDGYGKVCKPPFWTAHRLSYYAYNEDYNNDLCVLHKCNNRKCIRPSHLYQGTHKDNARDTKEAGNGRMQFKCGDKHSRHKLTSSLVKHIRILFDNKLYTFRQISDLYNLKRTTISSVCHRYTWRSI